MLESCLKPCLFASSREHTADIIEQEYSSKVPDDDGFLRLEN